MEPVYPILEDLSTSFIVSRSPRPEKREKLRKSSWILAPLGSRMTYVHFALVGYGYGYCGENKVPVSFLNNRLHATKESTQLNANSGFLAVLLN